ncbi:MAG: hypothetical protein CMK59_13385 [Proteobacteria bacterium]|nr:hypothetical protein [Pseudomonadota bacterium]
MSSISIVIIGDEILNGTFQDENTPWLIQRAKELHLKITTVRIISDGLDEIAQVVAEESKRSDYVITTGGVGPTHDDLTMAGIARAFDVELFEHPTLAELIRDKMGESSGALRMAQVPKNTVLWPSAPNFFPQIVVQNVIIFPGVPKLMKIKFNAIAERFVGTPLAKDRLFLNVREADIAEELTDLDKELSNVVIGSYPRFDGGPVKVILTIQGLEEAEVTKAKARLAIAFTQHLVAPE